MDDFKPLGARRKLLAQIMIALSVYVFGIGIEQLKVPFVSIVLNLGPWGAFVTVLWLVGMTRRTSPNHPGAPGSSSSVVPARLPQAARPATDSLAKTVR